METITKLENLQTDLAFARATLVATMDEFEIDAADVNKIVTAIRISPNNLPILLDGILGLLVRVEHGLQECVNELPVREKAS